MQYVTRVSLLLTMLALLTAPAVARQPAPAADCFDARQMEEAMLATPRRLAIALADGGRFSVDLAADCPAAIGAGGEFEVKAPHGWACSDARAHVAAADGFSCPITRVAGIDSKGYAELALAARALRVSGVLPSPPTLSTVEVQGVRARGFRGSTNFCVASRHVRNWSTDNEGLIIEVAPRRAAGNRYYRVELHGPCHMLDRSPGIVLRSGVGNGVVCGYPGDKIELASADEATAQLMANFSHRRWPEIEKFCNVLAVYPIRQD
ncbi:MAG: hypothetical protein ACT4NL_04950 [Pseudomarimonas sp.]